METYEDLQDVKQAYENLVSIQRDLRKQLFNPESINWETFQERLDRQSEIMESLETVESLDQKYQNAREEEFRSFMREFENLRQEITDEISEHRDEIEKNLESLDQSEDLLSEYQQEGGSSYHLDETI